MKNRDNLGRFPVMAARRVYDAEDCARSFEEDLEAHLIKGWVWSRPDCFLMARPVVLACGWEAVLAPWVNWHRDECDCWHVWLMAGDMRVALDLVPFPLPFVSFERDNRPRCVKFESLRRRILSSPSP